MIKKSKIVFIFFVLFFLSSLVAADSKKVEEEEQEKNNKATTEVTIYNPYFISVDLEVKCDWNNKKRIFNFHKFYILKGHNNLKVIVPKTLNKCEIWPG